MKKRNQQLPVIYFTKTSSGKNWPLEAAERGLFMKVQNV